MTPMLTRTQREAMRQALQGQWQLADALELACAQRGKTFRRVGGGFYSEYFLLFGILIGGRLRQFAYGDNDGGIGDVELITNLDGDVVYDAATDDPLPANCVDGNLLTLQWADAVLEAHHAALANPTQQPLIAEHA